MDKKKAKRKTTLPDKRNEASSRAMNQWQAVVDTEFKPKGWGNWTAEQLNSNKIK